MRTCRPAKGNYTCILLPRPREEDAWCWNEFTLGKKSLFSDSNRRQALFLEKQSLIKFIPNATVVSKCYSSEWTRAIPVCFERRFISLETGQQSSIVNFLFRFQYFDRRQFNNDIPANDSSGLLFVTRITWESCDKLGIFCLLRKGMLTQWPKNFSHLYLVKTAWIFGGSC